MSGNANRSGPRRGSWPHRLTFREARSGSAPWHRRPRHWPNPPTSDRISLLSQLIHTVGSHESDKQWGEYSMSYPMPRYTGDSGTTSATFRRADAPPDLEIGVRSRVGYLATGASTDGQFGLYRWDMAAVAPTGSTPGGHYHRTFSESFYILDGTVSLYHGGNWSDASAGDYLYVPPGGVHAFANNSGQAASMLVLFTPGAPREAYFEELADIVATGRELTEQEWRELYARHDQYPATPRV